MSHTAWYLVACLSWRNCPKPGPKALQLLVKSSHCTVTQFRITPSSNYFFCVAGASSNPFQPCARSWRQLSHFGLQQIQNPASGTGWKCREWCKWHIVLRRNLESPEYRQTNEYHSILLPDTFKIRRWVVGFTTSICYKLLDSRGKPHRQLSSMMEV